MASKDDMKDFNRLVSMANKRLRRLEKKGYKSPAYKSVMKSGGKFHNRRGASFNEKQKESIDMIDRLNKQMKENYNYKEGRITISSVEDLSEIDSVYSLHPKFGICIHNKLRIQIPNIKICKHLNLYP